MFIFPFSIFTPSLCAASTIPKINVRAHRASSAAQIVVKAFSLYYCRWCWFWNRDPRTGPWQPAELAPAISLSTTGKFRSNKEMGKLLGSLHSSRLSYQPHKAGLEIEMVLPWSHWFNRRLRSNKLDYYKWNLIWIRGNNINPFNYRKNPLLLINDPNRSPL